MWSSEVPNPSVISIPFLWTKHIFATSCRNKIYTVISSFFPMYPPSTSTISKWALAGKYSSLFSFNGVMGTYLN